MFGRKGCEDKRSSGQELFGTLQMLILYAVGLQLAFPSAADRWVLRSGGFETFGWICNPPAVKKRICNPPKFFRIANADTPCGRIANPTERDRTRYRLNERKG